MERLLFLKLPLTVLILAALVSACDGTAENAGKNGDAANTDGFKIPVTTTIGMITDVVREIGGEHVEVTGLMNEGVDPHTYKATQGDVKRLDQAEIIFYNGLYLEAKLAEVLGGMEDDKKIVAVGEQVDPSLLLEWDPNLGGQYDPHIWFDVTLWMKVTEVIRDTLSAYDPDHADDYRNNAELYLQQLAELHQYTREQIASIPPENRVLVTAHDAFGYFGKAYGIEVLGLQGISTATEAGVKDVGDLRDYLVEHQIKAIFVESSINPRGIEAVIAGSREKGHEVKLGGQLFSDARGAAGTPEGTYVGMVRHNVDTIAAALK